MENNSLRVCLLNDSFPPVVDGVANAVVNYARILSREEDFCAVATPDYPGVRDDYPFPVVRYPSIDTTRIAGYRAGAPIAPVTVAKLSGMNFDVLHSHCPVSSTVLARSLREAAGAPIIFTYHTKFDIDIAGAVRGKALQKTAIKLLCANISACDEVWVVSRGAGENLRSLGYEGEYIVMENGVDLPRGRVSEAEIRALSEQWSLPEEVPVYLFLGRMMWYKGLRLILDALAQVKSEGRDFRMVFVGDGMERGEVEAYAEMLGLAEKCRFVGAERDREKIRAWYCRADALLFPSTFDTNGLVVREAAACSLPSLLVAGSCAAEGIEDGKTGILAEENAESIAEKLNSPEMSRESLRKIGETAAGEIYISWDESVNRARERYRVVRERWERGGCKPHHTPMDELLGLSGDVSGLMEEWYEQRERDAERLRAELEKARERLERYL